MRGRRHRGHLAVQLGFGVVLTYLGLAIGGATHAWQQARPADESSAAFAMDVAFQAAIGPFGFFILAALMAKVIARTGGKSWLSSLGPGHIGAFIIVVIACTALLAWWAVTRLTG